MGIDPSILEQLGGKITTIGARIARKRDDGNFGHFEKSLWAELQLDPETDPADAMDELDAFLESELERRLALWMEDQGVDTQNPPKKPETAVQSPPAMHEIGDTAIMRVVKVKVQAHPDDGSKMVRVQGLGPKNLEYKGNWMKYGVPAYEALDDIGGFEAWKEKDFGEYDPTPGLKAEVELEGTKPTKVIRFLRD